LYDYDKEHESNHMKAIQEITQKHHDQLILKHINKQTIFYQHFHNFLQTQIPPIRRPIKKQRLEMIFHN
jgi:hypothetical protein